MALLKAFALGVALVAAGAAQAHVAADPGTAPAGAYQAVRFRVGHGCQGKATRNLRLEIPQALSSVRAQPKPGWELDFERQEGRITAVSWRGELPDTQFDEFALFMKLPAEPQTLYVPAVQTCDGAEARWTDIPREDARPEHPAPALVVQPVPAAHAHHD